LDRLGRKITVTASYLLAAVAMLIMGAATLAGSAPGVLWTFVLVNFFATMSWVSAYPTFSEIFPTSLRSTGIGFSVAVGHVGAAIAPPALVMVAKHFSIMASFGTLAGAYFAGALVMVPWIFRGPEGRGRPLEVLALDEKPCRA
jgi:MFS family permease